MTVTKTRTWTTSMPIPVNFQNNLLRHPFQTNFRQIDNLQQRIHPQVKLHEFDYPAEFPL